MTAWQIARDADRIELGGALQIVDAPSIWRTLNDLARRAGERLDLDLHHVTLIDSTVAGLVVDVRRSLVARGTQSEIVGVPERFAPLLELYRGGQVVPVPPRDGVIAQFGAAVQQLGLSLRHVVGFAGELVASIGKIARRPRSASWRSFTTLIARAGTDGVAIVLVLNFLVGFVIGFQSMRQLKMYGANRYVADLVGVAVTRELAPLMTAIIMAGRSGAAYAAELGTMCVSEELDALRTMGIGPVPYLVIPRIAALILVAPVLTLLGDVVGVVGGATVGVTSLGVTPAGYLAELRHIVDPSDVWTGLIKSVAFGAAIACIGCQRGLSTRGAASGVGRSTTSTVVVCLFTIVIIDTICTVVFRGLGV